MITDRRELGRKNMITILFSDVPKSDKPVENESRSSPTWLRLVMARNHGQELQFQIVRVEGGEMANVWY